MRGAMPSMSSSTFHASAGGSGTSNELSNSMELDLSAVSDHLARAESLPDPVRAGKELPFIMALCDELDADRQSVRAALGRHAQRWGVQNRPHRLKARIAGFFEATGRFAIDARREQHVDMLEYDRQSCTAGVS